MNEHFNGKCSWIKPVLNDGSVCLPLADILITGPFRRVRTEAAVSDKLSPQYPYLLSNRTDRLMQGKKQSVRDGTVQA